MKLDLSPATLDTIFVALQGMANALQHADRELRVAITNQEKQNGNNDGSAFGSNTGVGDSAAGNEDSAPAGETREDARGVNGSS